MEAEYFTSHESGYQDLLTRLERANDSLSYYKNNKEICMRDLQKLELENSALAEENTYLKRKIRNVEKNMSNVLERTSEPEQSPDFMESASYSRYGGRSSMKSSAPVIKSQKTFDCITTTSGTNRAASRNHIRYSCTSLNSKRELGLYEKAALRMILMYRV